MFWGGFNLNRKLEGNHRFGGVPTVDFDTHKWAQRCRLQPTTRTADVVDPEIPGGHRKNGCLLGQLTFIGNPPPKNMLNKSARKPLGVLVSPDI